MIKTIFELDIGIPEEEIISYYMDLYDYFDPYNDSTLQEDRKEWIFKDPYTLAYEDEKCIVEAVIFDKHEDYGRKWKAGSEKFSHEEAFFKNHADAISLLKQNNCRPATLWPLLCFGYKFQEYFRNLAYGPQWLVAPGSWLHGDCPPAVNTMFRAALLGYGEHHHYPRILGIRNR